MTYPLRTSAPDADGARIVRLGAALDVADAIQRALLEQAGQ